MCLLYFETGTSLWRSSNGDHFIPQQPPDLGWVFLAVNCRALAARTSTLEESQKKRDST